MGTDPRRTPSGSQLLPVFVQVKADRWPRLLLSASNLNARCNPANEDNTNHTRHPADCQRTRRPLHDQAQADDIHGCDAADEVSVQTRIQSADAAQTRCRRTMQPRMRLCIFTVILLMTEANNQYQCYQYTGT